MIRLFISENFNTIFYDFKEIITTNTWKFFTYPIFGRLTKIMLDWDTRIDHDRINSYYNFTKLFPSKKLITNYRDYIKELMKYELKFLVQNEKDLVNMTVGFTNDNKEMKWLELLEGTIEEQIEKWHDSRVIIVQLAYFELASLKNYLKAYYYIIKATEMKTETIEKLLSLKIADNISELLIIE